MKLIKPNASPTTLAGFSRASTATFVDGAGVLQTAGVNVARWQGGRLLVEAAATNRCLQSQALNVAPWGGVVSAVVAAESFRGAAPFWTLAKTQATGSENHGQNFGAVSADQTISLTVALLSGSVAEVGVGLHDGVGWGLLADTNAAVLEGPGVVSSSGLAALFNVTGLHASIPTLVRVTRIYRGATPSAQALFYPGIHNSVTVGHSVKATRVQIEQGASATSYIPTTTAAVTRAADVFTGGGLLHTSATAATAAYVAGTTYAAGALVAFERSRYQSLQASNTGRQPDTNPTWWARLGPTNQWAMFDDQVSTQTTATDGLRVAVATGSMDSLAVLGVQASSVQLTVTDGAGGPVVYTQAQGLAAEEVLTWADYFFNDPNFRRTQALFTGIPVFSSAVAALVFAGVGAVAVGHVVFGRMNSLGGVRYGARAGIKDFSRKETDGFGVTTFVRRAFSKTLTASVEVDKFAVNRVQNLLESLRATPVVWVGSEDSAWAQPLLVFGFYRDFYGAIDYPMKAIYSLEIEGLI